MRAIDKGAQRLIFLGCAVIAILPLCYGISEYGDWRWHLRWQSAYFEAWQQGVMWPIWLADADHGLGAPVFAMYAPGSFIVAAALQWLGFAPDVTFRLVLAIGLLLWLAIASQLRVRFAALALLLPGMFLTYFWQAPAALLGAACAGWSMVFAYQAKYRSAALAAVLCASVHSVSALMLLPVLAVIALSQKPNAGQLVKLAGLALIALIASAPFWLPALWLGVGLDHHYLLQHPPYQIHCNLFPLFGSKDCGAHPQAKAWLNAVFALQLGITMLLLWRAGAQKSKWHSIFPVLVLLALSTQLGMLIYSVVPLWQLTQYGWRWWPLLTIALLWALQQLNDARIGVSFAVLSACMALCVIPGLQLGMPSYGWESSVNVRDAASRSTLAAPEHRPRSSDRLRLGMWIEQSRFTGFITATGLRGGGVLLDQHHEKRFWLNMEFAASADLRQFCFPGWRAEANGQSLAIACEPVRNTMRLALPKGRIQLRLYYERPAVIAWALCAVIAVLLFAMFLIIRARWAQPKVAK
jgi:hypothetical protein